MQSVTNGKKITIPDDSQCEPRIEISPFDFRFALLAGLTSQNESMHSKLKSSYILKVRQRHESLFSRESLTYGLYHN